MNIVAFGANGRVGSKIVARLLNDGHAVTAFIHGPSRLPEHENLQLVQGDIHKSEDVVKAVMGSEAVVSALGSWGTKSKDILTAGMQNIIPVMEAAGITRIVSLTGAGAEDNTDKPTAFDKATHALMNMAAPQILRDGEAHIELLRSSSLDWTVLRSPIMQEGSKSGYELVTTPPTPWATIKRDDVVTAMVNLVLGTDLAKSAPFIVRK